ncbi:ubiquitin fusion degradation ufd1 [Trichoderma arundinaceum]|uniref:Ubiquitin fusion degradation ufd1 n=1 Tax=Trichoderma arundinaceum TaxID=490622 RepID=A0A395NQF1_TRIAR|nr:ubiquitin fusion degradation ufd1 [Trichoderma arundinaceum]
MSLATVDDPTREELQLLATQVAEEPAATLYDTIHNSLILNHIVPYLPVSSVLNLAAANRAFRALIFETPGVFRHLDLSRVKAVQFDIDKIDHGGEVWRNVQLDENLTEDDFYSGPLRGIFSTLRRQSILQNVQTLILDGLSVTSELCHEIINDTSFNVRVLSIREVRNLNQGKLRQSLQYACRPTRKAGFPRLQALYVFGFKDVLSFTQNNDLKAYTVAEWKTFMAPPQRDGDTWWHTKGRMIPLNGKASQEWANCMLACQGIIAFDAVLCHGPRHRNSPAHKGTSDLDSAPAVATHALHGCETCHNAPEALIHPGSGSVTNLPLLAPLPLLSSSLRAATTPKEPCSSFVPRCLDCVRERYCLGCQKWWCESCYELPGQSSAGHFATQIAIVDDETADSFGNLDLATPTMKLKVRDGLCLPCKLLGAQEKRA